VVGVGGEPVGEELRQSGEFGRINGIDAGAGHGREPRRVSWLARAGGRQYTVERGDPARSHRPGGTSSPLTG
jgi:hypothetical protein